MISTGIRGLDEVFTGLRVGDNVVWQIDDIRDYKDLVAPFAAKALEEGRKLIYMRFASHERLLDESDKIKTYKLDARGGFEVFTTQVHNIITEEGVGAYYVFDCLSELLSAWATDLMIGNFFMVTCPYLFELDTVTYFSLIRYNHSFKTVARIRETTQLLVDMYNFEGEYYVHPLKVWNRYSPTMFLPHIKKGDKYVPVTDSANTTRLLSYISSRGVDDAERNLDYWDRLFIEAREVSERSPKSKEAREMIKRLGGIMFSRDEKILSLVSEKFTLDDLLGIKSRFVGTGLIGGKTVGMLLSRKILSEERSIKWQEFSEPHDSFYIGSDVFYSYIVQNGWWKVRMQQKTEEGYFDAAKVLKEQMFHGKFPDETMEQFQQIIEYFGTSPIIVRSSSLLEDGFGNAFAGKYESVFCPNQGTPEQRYMQFVEAIRKVYASTMSEDALVYRKQRGLDKLDEQMALLVQRVSGSYHGDYFFPDVGGVGISYNTYVWTGEMEPESGMLRLVYGLGTRAVNRIEGDYSRVIALDMPHLRPWVEKEDTRKFSQHDVDVVNIKENVFETVPLFDLTRDNVNENIAHIGEIDQETTRTMKERGRKGEYWVLTFDKLMDDPSFTETIKKVLKTVEKNYDYPVEIEFTVNFTGDGKFKINVLQCRPLQTRGLGKKVQIPRDINKDKVLFRSYGYFLGGNVSQTVHNIVYVDPAGYNKLDLSGKYDVARIVGKLNRMVRDRDEQHVLLLGPGRWGTSTPSLGVPVSFSEINNISAMGEIAFPGGNLMPELSFGTHFFQDLVETNIFYIALFPEENKVRLNMDWLKKAKNIFQDLLPEHEKYKDIIYLYDVSEDNLKIMSDILSQEVVCFSE